MLSLIQHDFFNILKKWALVKLHKLIMVIALTQLQNPFFLLHGLHFQPRRRDDDKLSWVLRKYGEYSRRA